MKTLYQGTLPLPTTHILCNRLNQINVSDEKKVMPMYKHFVPNLGESKRKKNYSRIRQ